MTGTRSSRAGSGRRSSPFLADLAVWERENSEDNADQMERLRRNLRKVRTSELTGRQAQMLQLYYDQGMSMPQIARELGITKSAVSRTLARGRARINRYLQYSW